MSSKPRIPAHADECGRAFSLLELLVSVALITLLMSAVFSFMLQVQKRFQGNQVVSESNQSARAALELITQEVGQAGFNPVFNPNKTVTGSNPVTAAAPLQCVTLSDISQIYPSDTLAVDTGPNFELVQVTSTSAISGSPCTSPNQIQAVFQMNHTTAYGTTFPFPVVSAKLPFPSGILQAAGTSDDKTLEFFGDINADGTLNYVVYSLYAPAGAPALNINGTTYTLYTLYRSITPVSFAAGAVNNPASPLVQNVLYNSTSKQGPTGQPFFAYPVTVTVGVVPFVMTVVGTVVVNLSVAVNPESLETTQTTWYTMATQIRPLDLAGAVAANNAGGGRLLPHLPLGLPMSNPSNYYP